MMNKKIGRFFITLGLSFIVLLLSGCEGVAVLDPQGPIGLDVKFLILISVGLMLIVVVPVFVMVIWFSVRYRETNTKATYTPAWEGSNKIEAVVLVVPIIIVAVLSYLTWVKTIELDPYKPISHSEPPVKVQVVSLDWNWLFIYPDYDIASINKLVMPTETPISFELTSATVMTSFFIPELGSQMYAMAGMKTQLNLLASNPGTFTGRNLVYSGPGYESMHFPAVAMPKDEFAAWTQSAKNSSTTLSLSVFDQLNTPHIDHPVTTYASVEPGLFAHITGLFSGWQGEDESTHTSGHNTNSSSSTTSTTHTSDHGTDGGVAPTPASGH